MEKTFGMHFHIKPCRKKGATEHPIYLRITVNSECCEISTKRNWSPVRWNKAMGRPEGKTEGAKSLNNFLDMLQRKVYDIRKNLMENNEPVTATLLKTLIMGGEIHKEKYLVMEIFKKHNEQMAELVGRDFSAATLERYETSYKHTLAFLQWKYQVSEMDIKALNYEFISEYEFWLKSVRKCDHNTTMKYLSNFRKIINRCMRYGWLEKDPFFGFKMTKREVERVALTEQELKSLIDKKFAAARLDMVRDIFIFCCYSGLAYADVKKLKRSEIIIGIDGEKWIISKRQKTDIPVRIPLLPVATEIINKYADSLKHSSSEYVLPVLTNQKMNAYLKEIADVCGINKNLTFHIARHTFATTITLTNGVPIETVSKMLGHRNLKTTQHYAKILDVKISQDMHLLKQRLK